MGTEQLSLLRDDTNHKHTATTFSPKPVFFKRDKTFFTNYSQEYLENRRCCLGYIVLGSLRVSRHQTVDSFWHIFTKKTCFETILVFLGNSFLSRCLRGG